MLQHTEGSNSHPNPSRHMLNAKLPTGALVLTLVCTLLSAGTSQTSPPGRLLDGSPATSAKTSQAAASQGKTPQSDRSPITRGSELPKVSALPLPSDDLTGYHIIVSAGQSNTHLGFGTIPSDFEAHPRVFQLGRHASHNLTLRPGSEPFEHWTSNGSSIGHAKTFAERYIAPLGEDQRVLVIPGGAAGSGLGSGVWMPGGAFFEDLVFRVQHALWTFPGSEVRAVLWHQGEDDVFNTDYLTDLIDMITVMRQRFEIQPGEYLDLPFLLGGFSDAWVATNPKFQATEDLIQSIPFLVPHTAFVSSDGLGFNQPPGFPADLIHINAAGQREFGHRYFAQLAFARQNTL